MHLGFIFISVGNTHSLSETVNEPWRVYSRHSARADSHKVPWAAEATALSPAFPLSETFLGPHGFLKAVQ